MTKVSIHAFLSLEGYVAVALRCVKFASLTDSLITDCHYVLLNHEFDQTKKFACRVERCPMEYAALYQT